MKNARAVAFVTDRSKRSVSVPAATCAALNCSSIPGISAASTKCAIIAVGGPSGSPGKARFRFCPSSGFTREAAITAGMFNAGIMRT
jgi:hypothetical protein